MAGEAAEPGGAEGLVAAHRAMLAHHELQFGFPPYVAPTPPAWLRLVVNGLNAAMPVLKYVFWAGLAVAVAAILFLIGRELIGARWPTRKARAALARIDRPDEAISGELLAEADRLAAEGRFDEAAHLLLFRTIEDLGRRRPAFVRPSLTSRDIAALEAMPLRARSRFAEIAAVVEKSFFAGRPIAAGEFADCREAYRAFAAPESWAGAAA